MFLIVFSRSRSNVCNACKTISLNIKLCKNGLRSVISHKSNFTLFRSGYLGTNVCRHFHTSNRVNVKNFIEVENLFAHSILEKNILYSPTLALMKDLNITNNPRNNQTLNISNGDLDSFLKQNWKIKCPEDLLNGFHLVSLQAQEIDKPISDPIFDGFAQALASSVHEFTDKQISEALLLLSKWPETESINSRNFGDIWKALDDVCVKRVKVWNTDQMLFIADHWYILHLVKASKFMFEAARKISRKVKKLTHTQLVQTMFYINITRKSLTSMYEFEHRMQTVIDDLTLDELSILGMGFFKTQTRIRNPQLLKIIISRIVSEASNIHEITLTALLKIIRYSLQPNEAKCLLELCDSLVPQINRVSLKCSVHVALLGTHIQLYHKSVIAEIVAKLKRELHESRLKDIERITFSLTLFNYEDVPKSGPNIYLSVIEELNKQTRIDEIYKYSKTFARCVYYLSLRNLYDEDCVNKILSTEFILRSYGNNPEFLGREIVSLDSGIEIERPNYKGNRLSNKSRKKASSAVFLMPFPTRSSVKELHKTDLILVEILETAQLIYGGEKFVKGIHVLPHHEKADILVGFDSASQPCLLPDYYLEHQEGDVIQLPDAPGVRWVLIVVGGHNAFIRNTSKTLGSTSAKLRQLQTLGYYPLMVPHFEWHNLRPNDRVQYLNSKIMQLLPKL